jgi:putative Holliday junction resolvase
MPIVAVTDLDVLVPAGRRLIGLDVGTKTVGLALADPSWMVATPLSLLRRTRLAADLDRLAATFAEHDVGGVVMGLPVDMDGGEGRACQRTRQFARDLLGRLDLPLAFWDERLSTAAVQRVLIGDADLSRRRRAEVVDRAAAAYILQGALDAIGHARRRANREAEPGR